MILNLIFAIINALGVFVENICQNKRASFDYELLDRYEAGVVLTGDEIKSVRAGSMSLNDSFCLVRNGQVILKNAYIKPYTNAYSGYQGKHDARQDRVLLLNKYEIKQIKNAIEQKVLTIVPTRAYFVKHLVKVEIAVARGKKLFNKKDSIKEKDIARSSQRALADMGMK